MNVISRYLKTVVEVFVKAKKSQMTKTKTIASEMQFNAIRFEPKVESFISSSFFLVFREAEEASLSRKKVVGLSKQQQIKTNDVHLSFFSLEMTMMQ